MSDCTNCKSTITAGAPSVKCDGCNKNIHAACMGLASDEAIRLTRSKTKSRNIKFYCNACNNAEDKLDQLKSFLTNLVETKITQLEEKITQSNINLPPTVYENIVAEAVERINRSNNIIICNLSESAATNNQNPSEIDREKVTQILNHIQGDTMMAPLSVRRIGRTQNNKPRMIKVMLSTPTQARTILRNKKKLANSNYSNIHIQDDKTPQQSLYLKNLRDELKRRNESGENRLTIKYKNGVPTIVESPSKN